MQSHDKQILDALLAKDETVTSDFFHVWCRPLLVSLIHKIFDYEVDYDEIINELYLYLMEDDGRRLRTFQGRSSIYQWLKCVATRFFLALRDTGKVIENNSLERQYQTEMPQAESGEVGSVRHDVHKMLDMMKNHRYRMVIQRLFIDGCDYEDLAAEMNTSLANLYNIKKRAITEFTAIVLKEYGK